jgi:hypothetical protein
VREARNILLHHFTAPGAKLARQSNGGSCQYRTSDGKKCAFGVFIPDHLYDEKKLEGGGLGTIMGRVTAAPIVAQVFDQHGVKYEVKFRGKQDSGSIEDRTTYFLRSEDPLVNFWKDAQSKHDNAQTLDEFIDYLCTVNVIDTYWSDEDSYATK